MKSAATVAHISPSRNGIGQVPLAEQCVIPPGYHVVELKYCEFCGIPFPRTPKPTEVREVREERLHSILGYSEPHLVELRVDRGQKLCKRCHGGQVLAAELAEKLRQDQEKYKEQLPKLETVHLSSHPVKYDQSLAPAGRETSAYRLNTTPVPMKRRRTSTEAWVAQIRIAMAERGSLSWEDIADLIPGCITPQDATRKCYAAGLKFRRVGDAPRRVPQGPCPGMFILAETVH